MAPGPALWYEWSLRDEIFAAAHRWYLILFCCLLGASLGWLASLTYPSPHRVSKELFVGLNVYQSGDDRSAVQHAGLPFDNANDYKNWQMASLNTVIYMDPVLDQTLIDLQATDPYWQSVSRDELAGMLSVYWRNAGKWRLVAEHPIPMYATQAVLQWQNVVVDFVRSAVAAAQLAMQIDDQIKATAASQAKIAERLALLAAVQQALVQHRQTLSIADAAHILDDHERAALIQSAPPASAGGVRSAIETTFPPPGSAVSAYRDWIESSEPYILAEQRAAQTEFENLNHQINNLSIQYAQASQASLGLSAELLVQKISDRKLTETEVRPTGLAILVGSLLGFLLWIIVWLIRPGLKSLR